MSSRQTFRREAPHSSSLHFAPVRGKPGIWLAPSWEVLHVVLSEKNSAEYHRIAEANPDLFRNGPPKPVYTTQFRFTQNPVTKRFYKQKMLILSMEVQRAPYTASPPPPAIHPSDPRCNPAYGRDSALFLDNKIAHEIAKFDKLYAEEDRAHFARVNERLEYERRVAALHGEPIND